MPSFVRSKKDEAAWARAKKAVSQSKKKDESEFTDQDWALVNHIYHKMNKSLDNDLIDKIIDALSKARRRLSDEDYDPMEEYNDDIESELSEGFREFDPDEESSVAEDWLRENDPDYRKGETYAEYDDDEDEESHRRSVAEDVGLADDLDDEAERDSERRAAHSSPEEDKPQETGSQKAPSMEPKAEVQEEDSPGEAAGKRGLFSQPTREELIALRAYTRPWERRAREAIRLKADPTKNPVLAHQGAIIEARNKYYADRQAAYKQLTSSPEYKNADPITQMEMDAKFDAEWKAKNPTHVAEAMSAHHDAHMRGKSAMDAFSSIKDAKIRDILSGALHNPESFSLEEGLQHAGGVKGEEGTEGAIKHDPIASFAMGNQEFLKEYAKQYHSKAKKPVDIKEMMDYNEGSRRDITRILGEAPAKDPKFEKFFSHYYPLIGMNAHRAIKSLGLDHNNPDIDMSMLHEAGMHGLIQAINDYDHDNPSKVSFATHASNKIKGLQMTALKNQDVIPADIRQAQKRYRARARLSGLLSDNKHPDIANIRDRISRVDAHRQAMLQSAQQQQHQPSAPSTKQHVEEPSKSTPEVPKVIRRPASMLSSSSGAHTTGASIPKMKPSGGENADQ